MKPRIFPLRGRVNVNIGGATENKDIREVRVATLKGREGDGRGSFRLGAVTKVYHSKERKTPETARESRGERMGFCNVRECAPLALYTGQAANVHSRGQCVELQ